MGGDEDAMKGQFCGQLFVNEMLILVAIAMYNLIMATKIWSGHKDTRRETGLRFGAIEYGSATRKQSRDSIQLRVCLNCERRS